MPQSNCVIDAACPTEGSPTNLKDTRGSISSVDSSISLSYDAVPFTPRGSVTATNVSSEEDKSNCHADSSDAVSDKESSGNRNANNSSSDSCAKSRLARTNSSEEEAYEPPDEELTKKIVDQVEFYFSDENIVKDAFLLKHVRRNKEGYVSLKLIASFKRVKHIAKDWRSVRDALQKSNKLEINEAATKLRRKEPLPLYDQTTPSRTVVVIDIPSDKATIESIAEMFRSCGEIALVRILRPGNPIPSDVRPFYNKHPDMHSVVNALIEFIRTESAHNALNKELDKSFEGMRVLELNAPPAKKRTSTGSGRSRFGHHRIIDSEFSSSCQSGSEAEDARYKLRMQRRCSSPLLANGKFSSDHVIAWSPPRRWSRDSGSDSPGSNFSRSRSNSGAFCAPLTEPQPRRMSAGWESSSESYGSCRSRSSSGVSIPDIFTMRRYSVSRKDGQECCCCGQPKCESPSPQNNQRRYSFGLNTGEPEVFNNGRRCSNDCSSDEVCRKDSCPTMEYYSPPHQRRSNCNFERRSSLGKNGPESNVASRCRGSNCVTPNESPRRLSDTEGRLANLIRQRSFGNGPLNIGPGAENIIRLPRGPDGGRGFQRDLIEYALPE